LPTKEQLIQKISHPERAKAFTVKDLFSLMKKCGCIQLSGGRGSSIKFINNRTGRILIFDLPHPQNELYIYQRKKTIEFLKGIGEIKDEE